MARISLFCPVASKSKHDFGKGLCPTSNKYFALTVFLSFALFRSPILCWTSCWWWAGLTTERAGTSASSGPPSTSSPSAACTKRRNSTTTGSLLKWISCWLTTFGPGQKCHVNRYLSWLLEVTVSDLYCMYLFFQALDQAKLSLYLIITLHSRNIWSLVFTWSLK